MNSKLWTDTIKTHLELTRQVVSRLPAQEYLDVKDLNEILESLDGIKALFILQCEIQGFKTKPLTDEI